jgi:hypothetical protein
MPLYTRSDLIDAFNSNADSTTIDNIIANIDELATIEAGFTSDSSSEILTVDTTDTQYFRLIEDMDDSTSIIICDNIDELNFKTYKGVCQIESEQIYFGAVDDLYDTTSIMLYECVRGYNSTTPAVHLTDTTGEILYYINEVEYQVAYENITPGDSTAVENWKILNYEDVYNQALRSNQGIVITDSNSPNYPIPDWDSLIDNITGSGGLSYGNGDWIKYEFPDTVQLDRLTLFTDVACNVYFAWSPNDVDWVYVGAEADHTLTSSNKLVTAASESAASTNYWTASETGGTSNPARFPIGVRAKFVKIFLLSSVTIHDLVYTYVDVTDTLVVDKLSAITADVGLLTAGVIESSNFDDGGIQLDLDNDVMEVYDALGTLRVRLGKLS